MRAERMLLACLAIAVASGCIGPQLAASQMNVQPEASHPWTPPQKTILPKWLLDRVSFLHDHGLADPRGGEFRKVSVIGSNVWNGGDKVQVSAWLMPDHKHAVALDGLTYDVLQVDSPADLDKEVEKTRPKSGAKGTAAEPVFWPGRGLSITSDVSIAQVLISGRTDLAEKLFGDRKEPHNNSNQGSYTDFLSHWWDQAVTAHMRGDDALALREATRIVAVRDAYEKDALAKMDSSMQRTLTDPSMGGDGKLTVYKFLDPAPTLVEDSRRRLTEAKKPLDITSLKSMSQADRIRVLIENLDEVNARQWGQPGGVDFSRDPIVGALAAEGEAAVEPLIDAYAQDTRLTRCVSFGRDFFPGRNLITVKGAALTIIGQIAQFFEFRDAKGNLLAADQLRDFWRRNKGNKVEDRLFNILADDKAGIRAWEDAARSLFTPIVTTRTGHFSSMSSQAPTEKPQFKAETLRSRQSPSLADLLAKRALDMANTKEEPYVGQFGLTNGMALAHMLAVYEPKSALPTLRTLAKRGFEMLSNPNFPAGYISRGMSQTVLLMLQFGDTSIAKEYADMLLTSSAESSSGEAAQLFEPLVRYQSLPEFRGVAKKLFLDPASKWNLHGIAKTRPGWNHVESFVTTELLELPEIREAVFGILDDNTEIGETWLDEQGTVLMSHGNSTSGRGRNSNEPKDKKAPPPNVKKPFTIGDNMACSLSQLKGAPPFQPYWPEVDKQKAKAAMRAYLEKSVGTFSERITFNRWKPFPGQIVW